MRHWPKFPRPPLSLGILGRTILGHSQRTEQQKIPPVFNLMFLTLDSSKFSTWDFCLGKWVDPSTLASLYLDGPILVISVLQFSCTSIYTGRTSSTKQLFSEKKGFFFIKFKCENILIRHTLTASIRNWRHFDQISCIYPVKNNSPLATKTNISYFLFSDTLKLSQILFF